MPYFLNNLKRRLVLMATGAISVGGIAAMGVVPYFHSFGERKRHGKVLTGTSYFIRFYSLLCFYHWSFCGTSWGMENMSTLIFQRQKTVVL